MASDFYINPEGTDAGPGDVNSPWKTLEYAASRQNHHARFHLSAGTHVTNGLARFSDGARIIGPPITGERNQNPGSHAYITATSPVQSYITFWNGVSNPTKDNIYDVGVENVHFNAEKITRSAVYARDANMGTIKGCRYTLDNRFSGPFQKTHLLKSEHNLGGDDGSWWYLFDNFTEHAALVTATSGWWLNGFIIEKNVCISIPTQGATIPYITLAGQGGRHTIMNNSLEMIDDGVAAPAVQLNNLYQVSWFGNGFERIKNNKALQLRNVTSSVFIQGGGEPSGYNSGIWEWDGTRYVKREGMVTSPNGNLFMVAPDRTLL